MFKRSFTLVSPHTKDCDLEHYPDCYYFGDCKCWCHYDSFCNNESGNLFDNRKSKYAWYSIYITMV